MHDGADLSGEAFHSRSDHAQITNDPGILILVQFLKHLQLRCFQLVFKDPLWNTDEVSNTRNNPAILSTERFLPGVGRFVLLGV